MKSYNTCYYFLVTPRVAAEYLMDVDQNVITRDYTHDRSSKALCDRRAVACYCCIADNRNEIRPWKAEVIHAWCLCSIQTLCRASEAFVGILQAPTGILQCRPKGSERTHLSEIWPRIDWILVRFFIFGENRQKRWKRQKWRKMVKSSLQTASNLTPRGVSRKTRFPRKSWPPALLNFRRFRLLKLGIRSSGVGYPRKSGLKPILLASRQFLREIGLKFIGVFAGFRRKRRCPGTWPGVSWIGVHEPSKSSLKHKQNMTFEIFLTKVRKFFKNCQNGLKTTARKCYGGVVLDPSWKKFEKSEKIAKIAKTWISRKQLQENATEGSLFRVRTGQWTRAGS